MLFYILYVGCLVTASFAVRPSRQLDLGPVQKSTFQQDGYLPPIEPAGAQNDPVILGPTTPKIGPTHHGRDLCTDPFHSFLCANLKPRRIITGALPGNNLAGASTFIEPSKVLAPPLNDLEEPSTTTTTTTTTTTPKPKPTTTTTTERPIAPAPSNDVRTYLPPEPIAPAAASQDLTIIKPAEEHHHHPHHHGRDLCTDPFHSFLCAPLKPRKRITGNLPNSLPAATNIKPEIVPLPSNEIQRAYLPPKPTTTTTTTRRPTTIRFRPEPSNEIARAYLPPSTTTRRIPIEPQPSNEIPRAYLPPIAPQPSNIENNYLPPIEPAAAQNAPATIAKPDDDHHHGSHGFKDICSDPFHSFLCTVPKPRTRITGALPERLRNLQTAPSNIDETREKIPQPSETRNGYVYPKPQPSAPKLQILSTTTSGYSYPKPENKLILPSENKPKLVSTTTSGYSYPKPEKKLTLPTENKPIFISTQKPTTGYSYPKPENKLILPSENKPKLLSTTQKPTTGYNYPKPDNKLTLPTENKPVVSGYSYPKPQKPLSLPSENKPILGYDYPKPKTSLPEPTKNGYDYPQPSNKLILPVARPLNNEITQKVQKLPSSLKEARERLHQTTNVANIPNISNQNSVSDLIPVNQVQFPAEGDLGIRFGQRLKRRERKSHLIAPFNSHRL